MQSFIIHFFEKSTESEYTINRLEEGLHCIDFTEFHFPSINNYDEKEWKKRSKMMINDSEFIIFLYSNTTCNKDKPFENVKYELSNAFKSKKTVFLIPINGTADSKTVRPKEENVQETYIAKFSDLDIGEVVVTTEKHLIEFFQHAESSMDSKSPNGFADIEGCIRHIEGNYKIKSKNSNSVLYNKIQVESAIRKKLREAIANGNSWDPNVISAQYGSMIASIENLDERRQTINTVYTTINTALIALITASLSLVANYFSTIVGLVVALSTLIIIPAVGCVICYFWYRNLLRFKNLRTAKFDTLDIIESYLPMNINKVEWQVLKSRNYKTVGEDSSLPKHIMVVYGAFVLIGVIMLISMLLQGIN